MVSSGLRLASRQRHIGAKFKAEPKIGARDQDCCHPSLAGGLTSAHLTMGNRKSASGDASSVAAEHVVPIYGHLWSETLSMRARGCKQLVLDGVLTRAPDCPRLFFIFWMAQ
jgi:hypothetical protein